MLEGKLKLSKLLLVTLTVVMMAISVVSPATVFAQTNESAPTADPTQEVTQPHPNGEPGAGEPLGTGQSNNPTGDNAVPTEPAIEATPDSTVPTPASTEPAVNTTAPTAPSPDTPVTKTVVAKIGDVEYETLDEAVEAAIALKGDQTITVLNDCESKGLELHEGLNLTIVGQDKNNKPTITFRQKGIAFWINLTFKDCNINMIDVERTPYDYNKLQSERWDWMSISASGDIAFTLDNVNMLMDGTNTKQYDRLNTHGMYFSGNTRLNVINGSVLTIQNYFNDAVEWDGGTGEYNLLFKDSEFTATKNRSGFAGTFKIVVDNSKVNVIDNKGNGSNGSYYYVKNNSNVVFKGNGSWGMSATLVELTDYSTIQAYENGLSGVWTRVLNVDPTCTLDVQRNGRRAWGPTLNAGLLYAGVEKDSGLSYDSVIQKGAKVIIKDNAGSGIYSKPVPADKRDDAFISTLTILTNAVITNNGLGNPNDSKKPRAHYGGGVYNNEKIVLSEDVILYNNHADFAGDDIYNNNTLSFENINEDKGWSLDGGSDCNGESHAIDGWYHDAEDNRWNAHISDTKKVHVKNYLNEEQKVKGYKAAHGINVGYMFVSGTEGKELPQEVLDLLPVDKKGYDSGVEVDAKMPTSTSVTVSDGTWTFVNYKPNKIEGNKPEINVIKSLYPGDQFIGTWVFKPAYKVDYEFISDTEGKELPKEVLDLLPVDKEMYDPGEDVSAILPKNLEVKVPGGKWVFVDYDKDLIDNINSNGEFNGHWKYIADPVEETPKPSETPKPTDPPKPVDTPKPQPYDDGGPFTTDECGSVYDRWGNLMWKSPVCKVTTSDGYNMVNTADK